MSPQKGQATVSFH